jgi:hypothetical protein
MTPETPRNHAKLIGQLKDLADYFEPNDTAAASIIRQAVAALQSADEPSEAMLDAGAKLISGTEWHYLTELGRSPARNRAAAIYKAMRDAGGG